MKTVRDILTQSVKYLERQSISSPRRLVEEMICYSLFMKRLDIYLDMDRPVEPSELEICRTFLSRLVNKEPWQYIVGSVEFYGGTFFVNSNVLIPRPETEQLVDKIVKELKDSDTKNKVLWDICTGSGCIGISLKKSIPDLQVILSDLSPDALKIAKENADKNGVEVTCLCGDLFEPFHGMKADYIVSNPPYVSADEFDELCPGVRDFEPKQALFGGERGLDFYSLFSKELKKYLHPEGRVWFEIGQSQATDITNLFDPSDWKNLSISTDLSGLNRFFSLENE